MINVKEGYPHKLSNKEIHKEIEKARKYANGGGYKSELIAAANSIIQTGQNELTNRFTKRYTGIITVLTILSLFSAGYAIYQNYQDTQLEKRWLEKEIDKLESIENLLQ